MTGRRHAGAGAILGAILFVVGYLDAGSPPKIGATGPKVAAFFHDHHRAIQIGTILAGIGIALVLWAVAQLALMLRDAGRRTESATFSIASATALAMLALGVGLYGALAVVATTGNEAAASPIYELVQYASAQAAWPVLVMALTLFHAARSGALPSWATPVSGVLAVLIGLGALGVRSHGVFSTTDLVGLLGVIGLIGLIVEIGALLWRSPQTT